MTLILDTLFDECLLKKVAPDIISNTSKEYTIRPLARDDYNRGVLKVLSELTIVGEISETSFKDRFDYMKSKMDEYFIIVIVSNKNDSIIAVGSVILERKFIHSCSIVGHIEDIAVSKSLQGSGLGNKLISVLCSIAKYYGAYKAILDCSAKNVEFYNKCDFDTTGLMMTNKFQ